MSTDKKEEVDELLADLHGLQVRALILKLKEGKEISAADLNAVTNFLKANGITAEAHKLKTIVKATDEVTGKKHNAIPFDRDDLGVVNEG